ncbi:hypothetical protein Tco_1560964 [Tanacetum coccineum]
MVCRVPIQYSPPMLDRTDSESWQQRNSRMSWGKKDNGRDNMKSITEVHSNGKRFIQTPAEDAEETEGALQLGPEHARVFTNLSAEKKGKMILEGSKLTKDDRESQLYDEFERFCQIKGETIHAYYVRFSKLINDMRNIKMTMSRMQLNSKFVNNMLPEWSRFITEVKLNIRFIQPTNDPLATSVESLNQQYPTQSSESPQFSNQPSLVDNSMGMLESEQDECKSRFNLYPLCATNCKSNGHIARECHNPSILQDSDHFKEQKMLPIKNLEHQIQEKDNVIRDLKVLVSNVNDRSCEPYNANDVTDLLEQNERLRAEIEKPLEQLSKTKSLAPGMYAIDVEPIPPRLKNNRNAHLTYINHLKESVETVREIVEEARVVKPLDNVLNYACQYTKLSQELVEYVIGTCPKEFTERDSKALLSFN